MKGVILAGGLGTRLYPLTRVTNKHLLPIYDKPMVYYPLQTLVTAGIKDVLLITSGPHVGDYLGVLKNGKEVGLDHLEYAYQEKPDGGIADALSLAEHFSEGEAITVILGDNTTDADISEEVQQFKQGSLVFLKKVSDPKRFGVPVFDAHDQSKIIHIEEKPENPKSNFAVTGVYMYDKDIFDYIREIQPSTRGQLEITDANNKYITSGTMRWAELHGFWSDAGTVQSLFRANAFWAKKNGYKEEEV